MRDTTLMQPALGLTPPWTVVRSDFDTEAGRLDVQIDFTPGSRFACPTAARRTARPTIPRRRRGAISTSSSTKPI
jgi:hypothetical protein